MQRIKEGWKKLRYWQKCGILFGIVHIVFLNLAFEGVGQGRAYAVIIVETPLSLLSQVTYDLLKIDVLSVFWGGVFHENSLFLVGTVSYMAIGGALGLLVDKFIKFFK